MASRAQSITVTVTAWNNVTGAPQANDAANVTLKIVKDGVEGTPTNTPTNKSNGEIALTLTAAEMTADTITISGSSSTANVVIMPVKVLTENLPTAAPGASGGVPILDASLRILANLKSILGTDLTETSAGYLAAAFKKFFDKATPTGTINSLPDAVAGNASGLALVGSNMGTVSGVTGNVVGTVGGFADYSAIVAAFRADVERSGGILDALQLRITAGRALLLDKLNITGNVASSAEVTAIQNNTSISFIVPDFFERPDSLSEPFKLHIYLKDENGNMEAPDSTPTVTVVNQSGTDRSANLSALSNPNTGHYTLSYSVSTNDAIEQLIFEVAVVEGGATRRQGATAFVVDTSAVDFTASDRSLLTAAKAAAEQNTTLINALNNLSQAQAQVAAAAALAGYDAPTNTQLNARTIASADYATSTNQNTLLTNLASAKAVVDGIKAITDKFLFDGSNFVKSAAQSLVNYLAPDNDGIADAKTAAEAAQTNTTDVPDLIEISGGHKRLKATALEEAPSGEATISNEDKDDIAQRTKAQTETALNENTGIQRLQAVPGAPETPVFVIPGPDTPGLVNVLCRSGDFGTPRNGTSFTFRLSAKQAFIGEEFQVARQREKKTISGECLVPIYPSSTLSTKGLNPTTYDVLVNKTKVGSVTVPDSGGILKMVNGALIVEAAI